MTTYTCDNERYTPEAIDFASIEDFAAYCVAVFGEVPQLDEQIGNGIVVDETGETVLTIKAAN